MTRVKGGTVTRARRKKVLKQAKGYFGSKHRLYKSAQEQVMHSGRYSFNDRKKNKGNTRSKTNGVSKINAFQNHIPFISHKPWVKYHDLMFKILFKLHELLLEKI